MCQMPNPLPLILPDTVSVVQVAPITCYCHLSARSTVFCVHVAVEYADGRHFEIENTQETNIEKFCDLEFPAECF